MYIFIQEKNVKIKSDSIFQCRDTSGKISLDKDYDKHTLDKVKKNTSNIKRFQFQFKHTFNHYVVIQYRN